MPSIHELNRLFDQLPEAPAPAPRKRPPQAEVPKLQSTNNAQHEITLWKRLFSFVFRIDSREEAMKPAQPRRPNPYQMLKTGKKIVVVAAVDAGTISFFRFGQGVFDEWPMV